MATCATKTKSPDLSGPSVFYLEGVPRLVSLKAVTTQGGAVTRSYSRSASQRRVSSNEIVSAEMKRDCCFKVFQLLAESQGRTIHALHVQASSSVQPFNVASRNVVH
jgi:hypothetical protein